jgi:hypothetical protein
LTEVKTDYAGVARPQGAAYDIGAYEGRGNGNAIRAAEEEAGQMEASGIGGFSKTQILAVIIGALSGCSLFAAGLFLRAKLLQTRVAQPPTIQRRGQW